ncbi:MAG TPA: NAD(P)-dependent oxidoreductase [Thermoanaerobaculales bacterium]|nr:NAD(P)-dependent oxidoreductase [Thermoanaerobaculales bacterium]HQL30599.1 NAD(P)-dependent oxidoreductase [Thermoanaerobaculales bacterium]
MTTSPLVPPDSVARFIERLPTPIAVTGGTGFVGSHLVDTLCAAGLKPRVLVRDPAAPRWISGQPIEAVPGTLEDRAALDRLVGGAGTVFHLAGLLTADRAEDFNRVNRDGTARLVEAADAAAVARFVYVSSQAAAGPSRDPAGVGPEAAPSPISDYGRSKLCGERAVAALGDEAWWAVVRPPAIYGPRDTDVLEFFKMASRGLAVVPAGERWLTVAHVADVVRGLLAAAAGGASGRIYHLGEPAPRRLDQMLRELAAAGGKKVRVIPLPVGAVGIVGAAAGLLRRAGLVDTALTRDKAREVVARHWTLRTADSLAALGLDAPIPFPDGARETWAWYRAQGWLR